MKNTIKHSLTVNNKKYSYLLKKAGKKCTHVICEAAGIDQEFLNEDIPALLIDLPNLIIAELKYKKSQDVIRFRVSADDKKKIQKNAIRKGYKNLSGYLRDSALGIV